jgi:dephospho-CoA kinase
MDPAPILLITGVMASGKSTVARCFERPLFLLVSANQVAEV